MESLLSGLKVVFILSLLAAIECSTVLYPILLTEQKSSHETAAILLYKQATPGRNYYSMQDNIEYHDFVIRSTFID